MSSCVSSARAPDDCATPCNDCAVAIVVHCEDVDLFSNEKNNNVAGVRAADYNEVTCQLGKPNKRFIFEVPLHDVACRI